MKKLFYLLFISSVVLASCTKQDPIDVVCDCTGSSNGTGTSSSSSFVDPALVGHWKVENVPNQSTANAHSDATTIHLYFFSNGNMCATADFINLVNGEQATVHKNNTYVTLDGNKIEVEGIVINYSISNNTLSFYEETGSNPRGLIYRDGVSIGLVFWDPNPTYISSSTYTYYHLNNLVKQ